MPPSHLNFILDIRAKDFNKKDLKLLPSMIDNNIRGTKILFSRSFKYSKTLLKNAGVGNILSTFTSPSTFLELYNYGVKDKELYIENKKKNKLIAANKAMGVDDAQLISKINQVTAKIDSLKTREKITEKSNTIENIKYMYNLIFKENNKLTIRNIQYQISNSKLQRLGEAFTKEQEKSKGNSIDVKVDVYVTSTTSVNNLVSKKRLECQYKKQDILNKLRETNATLGKYIPFQYIKQTEPGSEFSYSANRNRQPERSPSYSGRAQNVRPPPVQQYQYPEYQYSQQSYQYPQQSYQYPEYQYPQQSYQYPQQQYPQYQYQRQRGYDNRMAGRGSPYYRTRGGRKKTICNRRGNIKKNKKTRKK